MRKLREEAAEEDLTSRHQPLPPHAHAHAPLASTCAHTKKIILAPLSSAQTVKNQEATVVHLLNSSRTVTVELSVASRPKYCPGGDFVRSVCHH